MTELSKLLKLELIHEVMANLDVLVELARSGDEDAIDALEFIALRASEPDEWDRLAGLNKPDDKDEKDSPSTTGE